MQLCLDVLQRLLRSIIFPHTLELLTQICCLLNLNGLIEAKTMYLLRITVGKTGGYDWLLLPRLVVFAYTVVPPTLHQTLRNSLKTMQL